MMTILGTTRVLGILGWPVEHSLSPIMQNAALAALGLDYVYVPFAVRPEALPNAVAGLKALGVAGFNVTIPHKSAIIPLLDRLSPEAELIGAVNTVKREGDLLVGYNTDCSGFISSLRSDLGFEPAQSRILLLGAGGAARAALVGLCQAGAREIVIANRHVEKGCQLVDEFAAIFGGTQFAAIPQDAAAFSVELQKFDILVNTTSVGMGGSVFPGLDLKAMNRNGCIYDMVYTPQETPLMNEASRWGLRSANGIGMLIAQGEQAFARWTENAAPAGVMKKALLTALTGK